MAIQLGGVVVCFGCRKEFTIKASPNDLDEQCQDLLGCRLADVEEPVVYCDDCHQDFMAWWGRQRLELGEWLGVHPENLAQGEVWRWVARNHAG